MTSPPPRKLAGGHHGLSARQVEADQKRRLIEAMIDLVGEDGYRGATVGRAIERAGVSRATFYSFFDHRADCFAAAQRWAIRQVDRALKQDEPLASLARLVGERPALPRLLFFAAPVAGPGPTAAYLSATKRWSEILGRELDLAVQGVAPEGSSPQLDTLDSSVVGLPPRDVLDRMTLGGIAAGLSRIARAPDDGGRIATLTFAALLPRLGPKAEAILTDQVVSST